MSPRMFAKKTLFIEWALSRTSKFPNHSRHFPSVCAQLVGPKHQPVQNHETVHSISNITHPSILIYFVAAVHNTTTRTSAHFAIDDRPVLVGTSSSSVSPLRRSISEYRQNDKTWIECRYVNGIECAFWCSPSIDGKRTSRLQGVAFRSWITQEGVSSVPPILL